MITAGTWEIPVDQCGEEIDEDTVTSEDMVVDCENEDAVLSDVDCKGEYGMPLGENDAVSSEEIKADCENIDDDESEVEAEADNATEEENEEVVEADSDVNAELEQENPKVDNQTKPSVKDESLVGTEEKPTEKVTVESKSPEEVPEKKKADEIKAVVKPEQTIEKAKGDQNEGEEIDEKEKDIEVGK